MAARPGDFHLGVGEFISILLPGAVVAYLALPLLKRTIDTLGLPAPEGGVAWAALAVVAYMAGHLVFLVGSFLDGPYDRLRQRWRPREEDHAYRLATEAARARLGSAAAAMNTYKYATATLALGHEQAHAEVRQLEADSKFFRSLVVPAAGAAVAAAGMSHAVAALLCAAGAALCAWRYAERRWKATRRAFEYLVALHAQEERKA